MKLANLALYTYTWRKLPPRATPDTPPQAAAMLIIFDGKPIAAADGFLAFLHLILSAASGLPKNTAPQRY